MDKISFAEDAWSDYLYWEAQDKKTLKKINGLLKEIMRTPYEGKGKPEPLNGDKTGLWSRRINEKDRIVYSMDDDAVVIYQCRGHYGDK